MPWVVKSFIILTCHACLSEFLSSRTCVYISELIRQSAAPSALSTDTSGKARCNHTHIYLDRDLGQDLDPKFGLDPKFELDPKFDLDPTFYLDPKFDLDPEFDFDPEFDLDPEFDRDPEFDLDLEFDLDQEFDLHPD